MPSSHTVRDPEHPIDTSDIDTSPIDEVIDITAIDRAVDALTDVWLWGKIGTGALLVLFGVLIGRVVQRVAEPRLARMRTRSFGAVFSRLLQTLITTVFLLAALAVVFPSVDVATLLGGVGVLSIAAGFAFQDVLSNLLAGILLIFRQPFVSGDQITIGDVFGTVEEITVRETRVRTFHGRLVVIPNIDVYSGVIEVQTDRPLVRTDLEVGVGYASDLSQARALALATLADVDGVVDEPAPEVELVGFGGSSMDFHVRYWTDSQQKAIRGVRDAVIEAIYVTYNEAGIEFPFSVVTLDAYEGFGDQLGRAVRAGREGERGRGGGEA